jgi:hypothetical protein
MRRNRGAPILLALAVAFGAVATGCEGDETVVEDEENGGTEEGEDNGGTDKGNGGETTEDEGDGEGEDSGNGGGDDSDLDVDVG